MMNYKLRGSKIYIFTFHKTYTLNKMPKGYRFLKSEMHPLSTIIYVYRSVRVICGLIHI